MHCTLEETNILTQTLHNQVGKVCHQQGRQKSLVDPDAKHPGQDRQVFPAFFRPGEDQQAESYAEITRADGKIHDAEGIHGRHNRADDADGTDQHLVPGALQPPHLDQDQHARQVETQPKEQRYKRYCRIWQYQFTHHIDRPTPLPDPSLGRVIKRVDLFVNGQVQVEQVKTVSSDDDDHQDEDNRAILFEVGL